MRQVVGPAAAIGIDFGGTELKAVLGNAVGVIGDPLRWRLSRTQDAVQLVREVKSVVESLASRAKDADVTVAGVCLAVPGLVDPVSGKGHFSANHGWVDFAIGPELEAALGLPIQVEHDVYAGALAEFSIGAGQDTTSGAFVPVGTGLAAALLLDGRIWRGASSFAGEIGHIRYDGSEALCPCGRHGCAELFASGRGIERRYAELVGHDRLVEAKEIAARAADGEDAASVVWQACVSSLARALAALTMIVDVEVIIVGGGLSQAGGQLFDPLVAALDEELAPLRKAPELRLAVLGQMAGARGAVLHALATSATTHTNRSTSASAVSAGAVSAITTATVGAAASAVTPIASTQSKFMLAFDHRASTAKELFSSAAVTSEQWELLAEVKTVIAAAAVMAMRQMEQIGEVSVLVDPECGLAAALAAQSGGVATAVALEVSGQRQLQLLDDAQLEPAMSVLEVARWGKVLLRWNPGDPVGLKAANLAALEQARSLCAAVGIDLLLELIVPPTDADMNAVGGDAGRYRSESLLTLLPAAVGEITEEFGPPQLWKLQGVASAASTAAVSRAASVSGVVPPIVVLGAGAPRVEIAAWFRAAAGVGGYAGFAIGRSIWRAPIAGYLKGSVDRVRARDEVVKRFVGYANDFVVASKVSRVAGGVPRE